jgi:hypothetical protein
VRLARTFSKAFINNSLSPADPWNPNVITGGCLCRAVRYQASAAPIVTRVC